MQYSEESVVIFTRIDVYYFLVQLLKASQGRVHPKHLTSVIIYLFIVHKTSLELHSKTVLQHSQPKWMGTCFKTFLADFSFKKDVNNIFSNRFRDSDLLESCLTPEKQYGASSCCMWFFFLLFLLHFKTSPHLLQLFRRILQLCFDVKLQECFLDNKTLSTLPTSMRVIRWWLSFYFWVNFHFKCKYVIPVQENNLQVQHVRVVHAEAVSDTVVSCCVGDWSQAYINGWAFCSSQQ